MREKENLISPLSVLDKKSDNFSAIKVLYTGRAECAKKGEDYNNLGPWTVDIQPTSECPQSCIHCSNTERNQHGKSLSEATLDQIHLDLEELGTQGIIYSGGGEPLAWNDAKLAKYLKEKKITAQKALVSNGVYFDTILEEDMVKDFFFIEFSINSHNEQLYNKVCKKGDFYKVESNVREAVKNKFENTYPVINGKLVINKENYKFAHEVHNYIKEFGFDYCFLRLCNNFEEGQDVELREEEKDELRTLLENNLNIENKKEIIEKLFNPVEECVANKCWTVELNHNAIIATDGNVYICSPSQGNLEYSIGNINEKPLKEIWGSERHIEVKEKLNRAMKEGKCNIEACRHNKFNLILEAYINNEIKIDLDDQKRAYYHSYFI